MIRVDESKVKTRKSQCIGSCRDVSTFGGAEDVPVKLSETVEDEVIGANALELNATSVRLKVDV